MPERSLRRVSLLQWYPTIKRAGLSDASQLYDIGINIYCCVMRCTQLKVHKLFLGLYGQEAWFCIYLLHHLPHPSDINWKRNLIVFFSPLCFNAAVPGRVGKSSVLCFYSRGTEPPGKKPPCPRSTKGAPRALLIVSNPFCFQLNDLNSKITLCCHKLLLP